MDIDTIIELVAAVIALISLVLEAIELGTNYSRKE